MKVKIIDIARRAGVGHATVDRVINERGSVKPATAKRVLDAARELGFNRNLPSLYRQGLHIDVILGAKENPICARINAALERYRWPFDGKITVHRSFVSQAHPERFAQRIRQSKGNAIIIYGQDHHSIVDAIAEVTTAGCPVITMVSDIPTATRVNYVGIDHYKAGRTAAFFVNSMTRSGRVMLLCDSFQFRDHAERISGCRAGILEDGSQVEIHEIVETQGSEAMLSLALGRACERGPLAAIYNAGVSDALFERAVLHFCPKPLPLIIAHERTTETERMLVSGIYKIVIDQNFDLMVARAMELFAQRLGISNDVPPNSLIPFTLHVRDSL